MSKKEQSDDLEEETTFTFQIPMWMKEIMNLNPTIKWDKVLKQSLEVAISNPKILETGIEAILPTNCDFIDRIIIEKEDAIVNFMKQAERTIIKTKGDPEERKIRGTFVQLAERELEDIYTLKKIKEDMICELEF